MRPETSGTRVSGRARTPRAPKRVQTALQTLASGEPGNCSAARVSDGAPCTATPTLASGSRFCFWHDPDVPETDKLAARERGGLIATRQVTLAPDALPAPLRTPEDATALIETTVQQVRTGQIAPAVANAIGYLVGVALKSFELDVLRRLDELERARVAHATPVCVVSAP